MGTQQTAATEPGARAAAPRGVPVGVLLLLLLPRVLRALHPEVWIEDDFYLASAWLVSVGERPYLDFVHPHLPVLEFAVAPWIRLVGPGHRAVEVLNQAALYATSVGLYVLAGRALGRRVALCAALLYAGSSLVFRYHVFERECFAGLALLGAVLLGHPGRGGARRTGAWVALAILASAVKLTALVSCAALLAHLAVAGRRPAAALRAGLAVAVGLGALILACGVHYGAEFWLQTFAFHALKGRYAATAAPLYPAQILDVLAPLFALGCLRLLRGAGRAAAPAGRDVVGVALALVASNYLFYAFPSPTVWAHNFLDFLPYVALVAGVGLDGLIASALALRGAEPARRRRAGLRLLGGAAFTGLCLATLTPLVNESWRSGSAYGFGFVPRAEVAALARALRAASPDPAKPVVAPAFLCAEAERRPLIRYPETYGVYREAKARVLRDGFWAARRALGREDFFERIGSSSSVWRREIDRALTSGAVDALVPDSPQQLLAIVGPPPARLRALGLAPAARSEHFTLWRRVGAP